MQGVQLPEDVHFFLGSAIGSLAAWMHWHTIAVIHFTLFFLHTCTCIFLFFSFLSLLCYQATQLAYVIKDRLKEAVKYADREKALKDVVVATAKDKGKVADKRAQASEKAQILAEQKLTELDVKLGGTELILAEVKSLNLAQVDEIANLKEAFEACEDKWYNANFTNAENFVEPIVYQARRHGFEEGQMAALQAMEVPR